MTPRGETILSWQTDGANGFLIRRADVDSLPRGAFEAAKDRITIVVAGRTVPLQVVYTYRTSEYRLVGASGKDVEPDGLAKTLIRESVMKESMDEELRSVKVQPSRRPR
jgi:hypothetical protein